MSQNILSRVPINGYIKLESIEPVDKVPDYTTVGGFHFKSKNGFLFPSYRGFSPLGE